MDYQKNYRYFYPPTHGGANFLIFVGVVLIIVTYFSKTYWLALIAALLIALGILIIIHKKKLRVSDAQYDQSVFGEIGDLQARALDRLGVDEDEVKEIPPISFDSYSFEGAANGKVGLDGLWRTNQYKCIMLFFSPNEVHCYTYQFDTLSDKKTEATDVYFYRDVVSFSTTSENVNFMGRSINREFFKLTTTGGTSISISLKDAGTAQTSINAMRALLREKKKIMQ